MAALLAFIPAGGHDQLWFLLMAERWLGGAQLYGPEAFDSNTPAIVWLSALPVLLGTHTLMGAPAAGKLLVALFEGGVAVLCARMLPAGTRAGRWLLALAFVTLFAVVPARDFGQRDALTVVCCLPYLLAAGTNVRGRWGLALLAALGLTLKPQLAVIPLLVELYLVVRKRCFRAEVLLFPAAGAVFLLAIRLFAPLYFRAALPTTLSTYWAIGHLSAGRLLLQAPQLHLLLAAALVLLLRAPSDLEKVFSVAGLAATLAYYVQGTGWYYQQIPGITLFAFALVFRLLPRVDSLRWPGWMVPATCALSLFALVLAFHFSGYPFALGPFTADRTYGIESPDPRFFREVAPGTSVATLTTSVDDAMMPVFRYHLVWAQRTNNLWTLPALLRSPGRRLSGARLADLQGQQRTWMVEDLERWQPQMILVARCQDLNVHCQVLEDRHDSLLAFFKQDARFAAIFARYHLAQSIASYDEYLLN